MKRMKFSISNRFARRGRLTWRLMLSNPLHGLSLGFGSGLAYWSPGTFGTLTGWLLYTWINPHLTILGWSLLIVGGFFVGCWSCQFTGRALGVADHPGMVWDEIVAIWLVLFVAASHFSTPLEQLACVLVFRFFDILKPPPLAWLDARWKNGFGVMLDDMVAALMSLLVLAGWVYFVRH